MSNQLNCLDPYSIGILDRRAWVEKINHMSDGSLDPYSIGILDRLETSNMTKDDY